MNLSEINNIINDVISEEIRKTIIMESTNKEVYHIKCDGEPIATFDSEKEAQEALPDYKAKTTGDLIIEKGMYESYEDMLDKLDEMGQELEEKENTNMKNQEPTEGNAFTGALIKAKEAGEKTFTVDGEEHNVEEAWSQMEEEECNECGEMNEDDMEGMDSFGDDYENLPDGESSEDEMNEEPKMCSECGSMMNEEGMCSECSGKMMESKKKTLRLKESEMLTMIQRIVKESVPGITVTKKAQTQSKKDNESNATEVSKKIKGATTFDGNDNPEFPKPIGKGEKVARKNTPEQEEEIADNRGGGLEDLHYDIEPSQQFKDRLKKSLEGHTSTGNSQDAGNVIKSDLGKNIGKKVERKHKQRKDMVLYNKDISPTKEINESKNNLSSILEEEIKKMKNMASYDKKTQ
jgi:hypothetical protein